MRLHSDTSTALIAIVCFLSASASTAIAAAGGIYNLGTLGGSDSEGDAINASGQVAGSSATAGDLVVHAFRYTGTPGSGGVMADLGALGNGEVSYGYGINASGQIAGYNYIDTDNGDYHAFRYTGTPGSGGVMADLGTLGGTHSIGYAINTGGQVAGQSETGGNGAVHAFRYTGTPGSGAVMADLGTLGGSLSTGYGINAAGQVAGESSTAGDAAIHAFRYTGTPGDGGVMADLGTLGGTHSRGNAINTGGQIAGYSYMAGEGTFHAFRYTGTPGSGGAMADLGTLGGSDSTGLAINAAGQVVGQSGTAGDTDFHAFLYTGTPGVDGRIIDLDTWLKANNPVEGAKWTLTEATGLSDTGVITGAGNYNDGPGGLSDGNRAFMLDASALVPEFVMGDFNRDGQLTAADISAMLAALTDLHGYEISKGLSDAALVLLGDLNGDHAVNNRDIQPLLDRLATGSGAVGAIPEPASVLLAACGFIGLVACLRRRQRLRLTTARAERPMWFV